MGSGAPAKRRVARADGVGVPETYVARSLSRDVAPILQNRCFACHFPAGSEDANLHLVTGTRDDLVNDNFAIKEQTEDCQADNPDGGAALAACVQGITKAQFLIEPRVRLRSRICFSGRSYGDRRMPSTTDSTQRHDVSTDFDRAPAEFQILYDWVAQGALGN